MQLIYFKSEVGKPVTATSLKIRPELETANKLQRAGNSRSTKMLLKWSDATRMRK